MTAGATANRMCRRGPIRWSGSAATRSQSLIGLGIERTNWCGLSMGGMVGQWLGAHAPGRIDKLILSNTSSYFHDRTMWDGRLKLVREKGLAAIVDANMERWFTRSFRERSPQAMARIREMFLATNPEGYVACGEAIRDMDQRMLLAKITRPTLVIAGRHDPATTLEAGEFLAQHIPGAKLVVLETAHIANMEQPQVYADTVLEFLLGSSHRRPEAAAKRPSKDAGPGAAAADRASRLASLAPQGDGKGVHPR